MSTAPEPSRSSRRCVPLWVRLGALLLVLGGLVAVVLLALQSAAADAAHRVAASAQRVAAEGDRELAALLAVEAFRMHDDETTRASLAEFGDTTDIHTVSVPACDTACATPRIEPNPSSTALLVVDGDAAVVDPLPDGLVPRIRESTDFIEQPVQAPVGPVDPNALVGIEAATWWSDEQLVGWSPELRSVVVVGGEGYDTVDRVAALDTDIGEARLVQRRGVDRFTVGVVDERLGITTVDLQTGAAVGERSTALGDALGDAAARTDLRIGIDRDGVTAFALAADGELVVVDIDGGDVLHRESGVRAAVYDWDSRLLIVGARSTVAWDRRGSIDPRPDLSDAVDGVSAPAVSAKSTALLVLGRFTDGGALLHVRSLLPGDWIDDACALAGRSLTPREWTDEIGGDPPTDLSCLR